MKKLTLAAILLATSAFAAELNLYSARHYDVDLKLYEDFTKKTGIKVNHTQAKPNELIKRLTTEGETTAADMFITADISNLTQVADAGLFAPVKSEVLEKVIPANLRSPDNLWFAMTKRARIVAYAKNRGVDPSVIKTYDDLAKPELKGRILMRSATAAYSKTLLSSLIINEGEEKARAWAKGVMANLATPPKGGDRDQARQVFAGDADFAIMNTYYIGLLRNSQEPKDVEVGNSLGIIFPNQDDRGAHINISGFGMLKAAKNKKEAQEFMEYLLSKEAQKFLTDANYEFPVREDVEVSQTVKDFGTFKADPLPVGDISKNVKQAVKIYDEIGFK